MFFRRAGARRGEGRDCAGRRQWSPRPRCHGGDGRPQAATSFNGFDKSPSRERGRRGGALSPRSGARGKQVLFRRFASSTSPINKRLFDRVTLDLRAASEQSALPPMSVSRALPNDRRSGAGALYFQFGRYLMIAGSRPGGQPLNLQGIWNHEVVPPWAARNTTKHQHADELLAGRGDEPFRVPRARCCARSASWRSPAARWLAKMYRRRGWG